MRACELCFFYILHLFCSLIKGGLAVLGRVWEVVGCEDSGVMGCCRGGQVA